jgi:hypothetical protein
MIFESSAANEVELLGIRFANGRWEEMHTAIPHTYFLQPVFHRMGLKPTGSSWGHLVEADLTPATGHSYADIASRPAYRNVQIRRDHVLYLRKRFQGREAGPDRAESRSRRFSRSLVERWFQDRVRNFDAALPPPNEKADWDAAKQQFPGLPRHVFREIRRQVAPNDWLKRGRRRASNARK